MTSSSGWRHPDQHPDCTCGRIGKYHVYTCQVILDDHTAESVRREVSITRAAIEGQYTVASPAGPAVITRIAPRQPRRGQRWEYEIETSFTGEQVRLHYGYANLPEAKRGICLLVANRLAATTSTGATA